MSVARLFCCHQDSAEQIANKMVRKSDKAGNKYLDYIETHYPNSEETLDQVKTTLAAKLRILQDEIAPSISRAGELLYAMRHMSSPDSGVAFIESHKNNGYSLSNYINRAKLPINDAGRRELLRLAKQIDKQYKVIKPVQSAHNKLAAKLTAMKQNIQLDERRVIEL